MGNDPGNKEAPRVKLDEADFTRLFYKVIRSDEYKSELINLIGARVDVLESDMTKMKLDVEAQETELALLKNNDLSLEDRNEQL